MSPKPRVVSPGPQIRAIAATKAARANLSLVLERSTAFCLSSAADRFGIVVSSLVLHRLQTDQKERTIAEMYRALQPGGRFLVVDFDVLHTPVAALVSILTLHFEQVADNIRRLPGMFGQAGFDRVDEAAHFMTPLGALTL